MIVIINDFEYQQMQKISDYKSLNLSDKTSYLYFDKRNKNWLLIDHQIKIFKFENLLGALEFIKLIKKRRKENIGGYKMKNNFIEVFENSRTQALKEATKFLINAKNTKIFNSYKYRNLRGLNSAIDAIIIANRGLRKLRGYNYE